MKNRILTIFLILIICVSMFPLNVFAASTSELELIAMTQEADNYNVHYFAPEGYSQVIILRMSETTYKLAYMEESGKWQCNTSGYSQTTGKTATITSNVSLEEIYNILFKGEYTKYNFRLREAEEIHYSGNYTLPGTTDRMYVYSSLDSLESINPNDHITKSLTADSMTLDKFYSEWYFDQNGFYPQPDLENSEYMKGKYYAILEQPIIKTGHGGGADLDYGYTYIETYGYVETCENAKIYADDTVFTYVVISTDRATSEYINVPSGTFWEIAAGTLKEVLTFNLPFVDSTIQVMDDVISREWENTYDGENRNNYPLIKNRLKKFVPQPMFYNEDECLNRYYFGNLEEACKFVLYGTAGAMYDYKEEGQTHYGYGYSDLKFNNYDIGKFSKNEIPNDQYPLGKSYITLRWHDKNVSEREFLRIVYNYFPMSSTLGTDNILRIPSKLKPEYFSTYYVYDDNLTEEENTLAERKFYKDFSNYEKTDKYGKKTIEKFYIYCPKLEEQYISTSWEIVDVGHSTYKFKETVDENGNPIIQSGTIFEDEATIQTKEDTVTGEKVIYDKQNNKYIITDTGEEKVWDEEKQEYVDDITGETYDPSNLKDPMEDWRKSLKEYSTGLENAVEIIEEFTDIIYDSSKEIKPLTDLLNKFMKNIPSIFRTIITFTILSFIIMRITRRE